jgi:iron complex transport system substrate-binding protein
MTTTRGRAGAALLAAALALAACGGDDSSDTTPTTAGSAEAGGTATTAAPVPTPAGVPTRIVSLSPTHTEMLFAIGAGKQVIAVDDQSNYPPEAPVTDLSGYEPNIEAIASYEPDLVVVADDYTGISAQLEALDIPVWSGGAAVTLDDVYAQLLDLGTVTGNADGAAVQVARMQAEVRAIVASVEVPSEPLTYYHELDDQFFSVTSATFIGYVYGLLGLENIADAADPDNASAGYPQLSPEYIIEADPDLIFLADTKCCGQDAATVAARPGWGDLTAVTTGAVVELDDDIASRWGPRIVELLRAVANRVSALQASGA